MPDLTDAVSKAVNNNADNAERREPNDALLELETLLPANADNAVTKDASTPRIEHEVGYAGSRTCEIPQIVGTGDSPRLPFSRLS